MENLNIIYRIEAFLSAVIDGDTPPEPKYRAEYWLAKIAGANITPPEPKYRFEYYLASIAGESVELPEPKDRIDFWLAKIAGADVTTPTPKYRIEYFLDAWAQGGGGTEVLLRVTDYAPITLPNAVAKNMVELIQYGTATQSATPTPDAPVDIMCNNGAIRLVHTSGLPLGYKLLEYVGGTGSQYIVITGLKLASTDIVESEFQNTSTSGYSALYGIYKTGESSALYANKTYYGYDAGNNKVDTNIDVDTNWHTARHDFVNGTLTVDSTTVSFTPFEFTNTTDNGVLTRYYNSSYGYDWKGNIRKFKVTRGNEVICDLIPAKNSSDEAGLYDLISGNFYTAAVGTLTEGSVVDDLEMRVVGTPEVLSVNTQTASVANLFGTAMDMDEHEIISGKVTRKFRVKALDGTEGWSASSSVSGVYLYYPSDMKPCNPPVEGMSTHFKGTSASTSSMPNLSIKNTYGSGGAAVLCVRYNGKASLEAFTDWLAEQYANGTPVIVMYPLATETTESVAPQEIGLSKGTNAVYISANVYPIMLSAKYYGKES